MISLILSSDTFYSTALCFLSIVQKFQVSLPKTASRWLENIFSTIDPSASELKARDIFLAFVSSAGGSDFIQPH